jgi:hypothetical protein
MLAASKAEVARREVGAVESLTLLLLPGRLSVFVTFVVRACCVVAVVVAVVHVYILRIARLVRMYRAPRILASHTDAVTMLSRSARVVGGKLKSPSGRRIRSRLFGGDFFIGLIGEARTESRRHGLVVVGRTTASFSAAWCKHRSRVVLGI